MHACCLCPSSCGYASASTTTIELKRKLFEARGTAKVWLDAVEDDFISERTVTDTCSELVSPSWWWRSCHDLSVQMKNLVVLICESRPANQKKVCARFVAQQAIGLLVPSQQCHKILISKQALAVHTFTLHNVVLKARLFVDSSAVCYACVLCLSTLYRCTEHLTDKNPVCLQHLIFTFTPIDALILTWAPPMHWAGLLAVAPWHVCVILLIYLQ